MASAESAPSHKDTPTTTPKKSSSSSDSASKKRKRTSLPAEDGDEELEIDVNLPEPPSKKALRQAKRDAKKSNKTALPSSTTATDGAALPSEADITTTAAGETVTAAVAATTKPKDPEKRSEHGIWIGNLPFTCTKATLQTFFLDHGSIPASSITRIHLPSTSSSSSKRSSGANSASAATSASSTRLKALETQDEAAEKAGVDGKTVDGKKVPANKGFAYVDFIDKETNAIAIGLSETLLAGRKVLIKDAKSFAGRPDKSKDTSGTTADGKDGKGGVDGKGANGKAPSKRVFVGNLAFDVTKEALEEHYAQAGEIEDVHVATFEDSGKCKGFAWVRFLEVESAERAVKGFVFKEQEDDADDVAAESDSDDDDDDVQTKKESGSGSEDEDDNSKTETKKAPPKKTKKILKKLKPRKWFINRLMGRPLRCEFAEDSQTRYNKRFRKGAADRPSSQTTRRGDGDATIPDITEVAADGEGTTGPAPRQYKSKDKDERLRQRRQKHVDARNIKPGAALASAPRASGAIQESTGSKITFD